MVYIETLLLIFGLIIGIISTISDIRTSKIKNRLLLIGSITAIVLSLIYYIVFVPDIWLDFVLNALTLSAIAILLYAFRIWGGGDAKLLIFLALCFPARLYFYLGKEMLPLMNVLIIIFSLGYIYLLIESFILYFSKTARVRNKLNKVDILGFFKSYILGFFYISALVQILDFIIPGFVERNSILLLFVNFFAIILLSKSKLFSKLRYIWIPFCLIMIFFALSGNHFNLLSSLFSFISVVLLMLLKRFIEVYNYKTIPISALKPGMILSYASVIPFELSRVQGLPQSTTEDLRSRLSENECDSINRWAKTNMGTDTIQIVKKIPFAVFIFAGFILFGLMRWIS